MRNRDGTPKLSVGEQRMLAALGAGEFWKLWNARNEPDNVTPLKDNVTPLRATGPQAVEGPPPIRVCAGLPHIAADEATRRLVAAQIAFYQRAGMFVRPQCGLFKLKSEIKQPDGSFKKMFIDYPTTFAKPILPANLLEALARIAIWEREKKGRWFRMDPPNNVVQLILARAGEDFPVLTSITTVPFILRDGEIVSEPGYHQESGVFLQADGRLDRVVIPAVVEIEDARAAADLLQDLLVEFPFVGSVDLAVAMSALITPIARKAIDVAPLHAISATNIGTGKSYLTDISAAIRLGSDMPSQGARDDIRGELDKGLTSAILYDLPMLSIDNVTTVLSSPLMAQIIERGKVVVRPLGVSESVEVPNTICLFSSGNNFRIKQDLIRRVLLCSLDRAEERPWQHRYNGSPVGQVLRARGKYIAAALTIARFGIQMRGKQPLDVEPINSFDDWSTCVREPLIRLGYSDPVYSQNQTEGDDPDRENHRLFLHQFETVFGSDSVTSKEIAAREAMRDSLLSVAYDKKGGISIYRLGHWLAGINGRIVDGRKIVKVEKRRSSSESFCWRLVRVEREES